MYSPAEHSKATDGSKTSSEPTVRLPGLCRSLLLTTGVRLWSATGTILLSIVLARLLSKTEFGIFSFCLLLLSCAAMVARFGVDQTMLRFGGEAWQAGEKQYFQGFSCWAFRLTSFNAVAFSALSVFLLMTGIFPAGSNKVAMTWMTATLVPWALTYTVSFALKAAHRAPLGAVFETGTISQCTAIVMLAMFALGWDIRFLLVAQVLCFCAFALLLVGGFTLYLTNLLPKHDVRIADRYPDFISSCKNVLAVALLQLLANWGAIIFLYLFADASEVANYSGPARFAMATTLLLSIVILVLSPRLAGLHAIKEFEELQRLAKQGTLIVSIATMPILLVFILASRQVLSLLGDSYQDQWPVLSVIAVGQMVGVLGYVGPTLLLMTGRERQWRRAMMATSGFCIVATAVLSFYFGAVGAAFGTALYQATQSWVAISLVRRTFGFWILPFSKYHEGEESGQSITQQVRKALPTTE